MWVHRKIAVTPMDDGIRVAGISEFGSPGRKPNYYKLEPMLAAARELVRGLDTADYDPWMGSRPATPDYLPVIGRSPLFRNAFFACGHGHSGLMFGPVTAQLIADLVADKTPVIDLGPFSPGRFAMR